MADFKALAPSYVHADDGARMKELAAAAATGLRTNSLLPLHGPCLECHAETRQRSRTLPAGHLPC